ncbi:hypothetical protein ABT255_61310, partial [Streptomyces mirabilis]|uniref:hypothetical protein n=1 Tax=Streptomyces mirabilis TaxID=68239 RepID=UPI00335BCA85
CLVILFMEPEASVIVESGVDLTSEQMEELRELAGSRDVPADVALRARIVLWSGEGRQGGCKFRDRVDHPYPAGVDAATAQARDR